MFYANLLRQAMLAPFAQCSTILLDTVLKRLILSAVFLINFDSESMIKTFDICQELKILSPGQINLEKWLNDNLSTYGDTFFFEGCLKFSKEIHVGLPQDILQHSGAVVLQGHAGQNVSCQHLLDEMKKLHAAFIQNSTKL
ncbi:hypothetical protein MKW92_021249 [Papaver armeniacum]|nr:hypothetical protein MKW92_021249 [Papaver armeniacum]